MIKRRGNYFSVAMVMMLLISSLVQPILVSAEQNADGDTVEVSEQDAVVEETKSIEAEEDKQVDKKEVKQEAKKPEEKSPTKNKGDPKKQSKKQAEEKQDKKVTKEEKKSVKKDKEESKGKEEVEVNDEEENGSVLADGEGKVFKGVAVDGKSRANLYGLKALKQPSKAGNKIFSSLNEGNLTNEETGRDLLGYVFRDVSGGKLVPTTAVKQDEKNDLVYCLNLNLASPSVEGIEYKQTEEQLSDLEYSVMYYGYKGEGDITGSWSFTKGKNKDPKDSQWKKYYATQLALYSISDDGSSSEVTIKDLSAGSTDSKFIFTEKESKEVLAKITELTNKAESSVKKVPKEEKVKVGFSEDNVNFKYNVETGKAQTQQLKLNVSNDKADVTVKGDVGKAKIIQDGKEVDLDAIKNGKEFVLELPYKDIEDVNKVNIDVESNITFKNFTKYTPLDSEGIDESGVKYQRIAWVGDKTNTSTSNLNIVYEKELGEIGIDKVDEKGNALQGAEFTLYDNEEKEIGKKETNEKGKAVFTALEYGDYVVKETKGIEGYVFDKGNKQDVKVNTTERQSIAVENRNIKGMLNVIKEDEDTKEPLENAVFKVTGEEGNELGTFKTDKEGKGKIAVPYGKYSVEEVKQPEGYILSDVVENLKIENDGEVKNIGFTNKKINDDITVIKTDKETGELLAGVTFEVRDREGNLVKDVSGNEIDLLITDENGTAGVNLPKGEYTIKEVATLDEYTLGEFEEDFQITGKETPEELTFKVQNSKLKGSLLITKLDAKTETTLSGAVFEVKDKNGEVIEKLISDKNGQAYLTDLGYGEYSIKEIKAPEGYKINKKEVEFKIDRDNLEEEVTISNKRQIITIPQSGSKGSIGMSVMGTIILLLGLGLLVGRKRILNR